MRELGPLEKPDSQDMARVVELFTMMAENDATKDKEAGVREKEVDMGQKLGVGRVGPVFLDYLHFESAPLVILDK